MDTNKLSALNPSTLAALLAEAPALLAAGYIEAVSAADLAEYWLEAQFAAPEADEPGGASDWTEEDEDAFTATARDGLLAAAAAGGLTMAPSRWH